VRYYRSLLAPLRASSGDNTSEAEVVMTDPSKISELIERSSLGTDGARGLRGRTPPDVAQRILDRAAAHERTRDRATADPSSAADLLREIRDGDLAAWDEILRRYEKLVVSTVRSFRLYDADALDAVQMTWLRLAENADLVQFPERLGGWLVTTARRECLRILRQAKSGPNLTDTAPETTANSSAHPEPPTPDLTQTLRKLDEGDVIEGPGIAGMSKTATIEVGANDSNQRKAGPREHTRMTRHRRRTGCKCDMVVKKGFVTYVCAKCGKEI
jgi:RNA polymerase sigma factor (sigma-70 family)